MDVHDSSICAECQGPSMHVRRLPDGRRLVWSDRRAHQHVLLDDDEWEELRVMVERTSNDLHDVGGVRGARR